MSYDYLKRYLGGEHHAWDDLVRIAPTVATTPELHAEAVSVAEAIMNRVHSNVSILRRTLIDAGASIGEEGTPLMAADDLNAFDAIQELTKVVAVKRFVCTHEDWRAFIDRHPPAVVTT